MSVYVRLSVRDPGHEFSLAIYLDENLLNDSSKISHCLIVSFILSKASFFKAGISYLGQCELKVVMTTNN